MPGDSETPYDDEDILPFSTLPDASGQQTQKIRSDAALVYGVQSPVLSRIRNIQKNMRHALLEAGVTDPELLADLAEFPVQDEAARHEAGAQLPPVME